MTGRLRAKTVPVPTLTAPQIEAMWRVFDAYYVDVDRARFEADLLAKELVILLLDGEAIVGFSTFIRYHGNVNGRPYVAAFSGDTVVGSAYWGQTALQRAFAWQICLTWARWIDRPTYWFLISKGYKTWLLLTRNWTAYWPAADRPTPAFEDQVMRDMAARLFGSAYLPDEGIVRFERPMGRLREGVAPPERASDDPDVRYFLARNPGHAQGDELCCLGRLSLSLWIRFTLRHLLPFLRRRST